MSYVDHKNEVDTVRLRRDLDRGVFIESAELREISELLLREVIDLRDKDAFYEDCYPCECCSGCRGH